MALVIPNTFSAGAAFDPTEVNQNFTAVANKMGAIVNEDIASGAAINVDKLSGQYERVSLSFLVPAAYLAAGSPDGYFCPFHMPDTAKWTVDRATWCAMGSAASSTAVGNTKVGKLEWGHVSTSTGAFTAIDVISSNQNVATANAGAFILSTTAITAATGGGVYGFQFILTSSTGAASNGIHITVTLKRKIQAS